MTIQGNDGFLKTRKESTGRPPIAKELKKVYVGFMVEPKHKAWLESFDKGEKSERVRKIFDIAIEIENAKKSVEGENELKPCPFCSSQPEFDDTGTQLELACNDCGIVTISVQISDLMSIDERCNNWDGRRYKTEFVERAKKEAVAQWNNRV